MSKTRGHIPIRTCVGCGAKRDKKDLIRLVLNCRGMVVQDNLGKGRGAYICRNENCMSVLKTGKGLGRAFKGKYSIPISARSGGLQKGVFSELSKGDNEAYPYLTDSGGIYG